MHLRVVARMWVVLWLASAASAQVILPSLATNLVCYYDFEHPGAADSSKEVDQGFSATDINLINGGASMRKRDGAYAGSTQSLQTQQINPAASGNDDWKAGLYQSNGVASLSPFNAVAGITLMGWVKPTGANPNLNSGTPATNDLYNAVGLFGLLAGNSEGHGVRALLEVINVSGVLRLVALGRRIDGGNSWTLATTNDWQTLLPSNTWTHLTATFDFDNGAMALYRNGSLLGANYTTVGDVWGISGGVEPDVTSATNPAGIKIGGSYPQNSQEFNTFNGRFDDLMFFNKVLSAAEVQLQFANFTNAAPVIQVSQSGPQLTLSWPRAAAAFALEVRTNISVGSWGVQESPLETNDETISVTLPMAAAQQFFRLTRP